MLVVGYDAERSCWLVRSSSGAGCCQAGCAAIGYGECDIDRYAKVGVHSVNPDPQTKRAHCNGCLLLSGNGACHRNFELVRAGFPHVRYAWRNCSTLAWVAGPLLANAPAPQQLLG
jgi:hypothetical protein